MAWIYRRVVFKLFHGGREEDNLNCLVFRREYLNGRRKCSAWDGIGTKLMPHLVSKSYIFFAGV